MGWLWKRREGGPWSGSRSNTNAPSRQCTHSSSCPSQNIPPNTASNRTLNNYLSSNKLGVWGCRCQDPGANSRVLFSAQQQGSCNGYALLLSSLPTVKFPATTRRWQWTPSIHSSHPPVPLPNQSQSQKSSKTEAQPSSAISIKYLPPQKQPAPTHTSKTSYTPNKKRIMKSTPGDAWS